MQALQIVAPNPFAIIETSMSAVGEHDVPGLLMEFTWGGERY